MRAGAVAACLATLLLPFPGAHAWSTAPERPHEAEIVLLVAGYLPDPYRRFLLGHHDALMLGAVTPERRAPPEDPQAEALAAYEGAVRAMRDRNATQEVAFRLGVLAHHVAEIGSPARAGGLDAATRAGYERQAYDHRLELAVRRAHEAKPSAEARLELAALDQASRDAWPALDQALREGGGAWTPPVAHETEAALARVVTTAGDILLAAFEAGSYEAVARRAADDADARWPAVDLVEQRHEPAPSQWPKAFAAAGACVGFVLVTGAIRAWRSFTTRRAVP